MMSLKQNVLTPNGEVPIESLKKGDLVIGKHGEIGQVKKVDVFTPKENKKFYIVNGKYAFAPHQSVYASGRLIHARQLSVGHFLELRSGRFIKVTSLRKWHDTAPKVRIVVDRPFHILNWFRKNKATHTYYLNGVLVHNASRYWVSGTGDWDTSTTTHWGSASGTADNASVPTSSDNVIFDAASNATAYTCTITVGAANCADIDFTNPASGALTFAGSQALNVYGSFTIHSTITRTYTGTITFRATSTGKTITFNNVEMRSTTVFDGVGGGWTLQDNWVNGTVGGASSNITITRGALDINGKTVTCGTFASSNSNTRTVTFGAATINCTTWTFTTITNLTFNIDTASINCTTGVIAFSGGGLTYNGVVFSGNNVTLSGANTFSSLTRTTTFSAKTHSFILSANQVITGTLTIDGQTSINRMYVASDFAGTQRTLTAAVVSVVNADFEDIIGAGAGDWDLSAITGLSGDCGNNSGITFTTPADQHWISASGGTWSTASNWTSRVPLPQDDVFMDNAFGTSQTVFSDMPRLGRDIDWTGATWTTALTWNMSSVTGAKTQYGSLILISGMATTNTSNSSYNLVGRLTSHVLTTNTVTIPYIGINSRGGKYTLGSSITIYKDANSRLDLNAGSFDSADYNITAAGIIFATGTNIDLGSSLVIITGVSGTIFSNSGTIAAGTYTIKFTDTANGNISFNGGNKTYNNVWFARGGSTGSITISGGNTFNDFKDTGTAAHSIIWTAATTTHFTTFTVSGADASNRITLTSTTTGVYNFIKDGGGIVSCDFLDIYHCVARPWSGASGADTWYAGANSVNHQSDSVAGSGWIFTAPPVAANDERPAKITGEAESTSERVARITGYTTTSSERDAKLSGKASDASERPAKLHGIDTITNDRSAKLTGDVNTNSERSAKLTGKVAATAERSAKTHGTATANSERGGKITGIVEVEVNSERNAKLIGQVLTNSERSAKLLGHYGQQIAQSDTIASTVDPIVKAIFWVDETKPSDSNITYYLTADGGANWEAVTPDTDYTFLNVGTDLRWRAVLDPSSDGLQAPTLDKIIVSYTLSSETNVNDERAAKIHGVDTTSSERSAKIVGSASATSERNAKVSGVDTSTSERSGKLTGSASAQSERETKITGKDQSTSERSAKLTGKESATSERSAKITGKQATQSERSAKITGSATANSERDAKITGKASATSERGALIHGKQSDTSERNALITGSQPTSSERNAKISGVDTITNDRNAVIHGKESTSSERGASITGTTEQASERYATIRGKLDTSSEREAKITGQQIVTDERSGKIAGVATITNDRQAKVTGSQVSNDERSAKLTGQTSATSERNARLTGIPIPADSERSAKISGKQTSADERGATIIGIAPTSDERGASIRGKDTYASERQSVITGKLETSDERNVKITGKTVAVDERNIKITGKATATDERFGKITGKTSATDERSATLKGTFEANSERQAVIHGVMTTSDERSTKITGQTSASSERGATLKGHHEIIKSVYITIRSLKGTIGVRSLAPTISIRALDTDIEIRSLKGVLAVRKLTKVVTVVKQ